MAEPTLVLVVVDQIDTYHIELLDGVRQITDPAGLSTLVHAVDPKAVHLPATFANLIASGRVCGVLSTQLASRQAHDRLGEVLDEAPHDVAYVHIGLNPKADAWTVLDNSVGMRSLLDHVLDGAGVRRPVVLRGIPHQPDSQEREALVREALAARGLTLPPEFVLDGGFARMQSYQALTTFLRGRRDLDAVIAFNDRSALGAADALELAGLRVPEDVVLTGFDNEPFAAELDPPLTSVDQDLHAQGRAAAELLVARLHGEDGPREARVGTRLVPRASSHRGPEPADPPQPAVRAATSADVALAMSRSFMACTSVESLAEELVTNLQRLGVLRCLLVLEEPDRDGTGATGRLVLDYDGESGRDARTAEPFPLAEVLPGRLLDEVGRRSFVMEPLSIGDDHFGYVIFDAAGGTFFGEALQLDLSRALSTIEGKRRLAEYAQELERRVALRTEQLESEVAARRRTELDLVRLNAELRKSVFIDGLTRIANRTALDETLAGLWREHQESGRTLSMILVDVDHFKAYNDHYGHLRGDDVLRTVAACLSEAVRGRDDLAARYGGEEFAVLLPQTDEEGAAVVAERVRRLVREAAIPHAGQPGAQRGSPAPALTVSLGVAAVRPGVEQVRVDHLIALADQALYRAKATGRDRVVLASACEPLLDDRTVPTGWQI